VAKKRDRRWKAQTFHHHDFEKSLGKAVEAFKVWASRRIPAGRKFLVIFFLS